MPFIVTPSQLIQRSELYHQLGALISAGVGLPQALEIKGELASGVCQSFHIRIAAPLVGPGGPVGGHQRVRSDVARLATEWNSTSRA